MSALYIYPIGGRDRLLPLECETFHPVQTVQSKIDVSANLQHSLQESKVDVQAEATVGVEFFDSIIRDLVSGSHVDPQGSAPESLVDSVWTRGGSR